MFPPIRARYPFGLALRRTSLLCLLVAPLSLGCAFGEMRWNAPLEHEYSLELIQKRYSDLVRFGNYKAASRYVDRAERNAFLSGMPKEGSVRFLDYESQPLEMNPDLTYALVEVTYVAYSPWTLVQFPVTERQEWTRPDGFRNDWSVKSSFEGLEPFVTSSDRSAAIDHAAALPR